jgi:tetratricopeptide (TPR) repeat protein
MLMAEDNRRVRGPDTAEPNPSLLLEDDGEGVGSLLASLTRLRSALDRERAEAPALLAELLALPPLPPSLREERLRQETRFHNWGLCELLLARSTGDEADPAEAGRLAALALAGADLVDRARHAAPVVEDLKAKAWAAAGDACLRQGDLPGAEDALRAAAGCLAQGTGDLLVEARLLEFEALVRRQQGRSGEAAALLKMAAARYREIGESELLARVLAARNEILGSNKPAGPA